MEPKKEKDSVRKSRFVVISNGDVDDIEDTISEAVDWINANYNVDDADDIKILEVVNVYELVADKLGESRIPLDQFDI